MEGRLMLATHTNSPPPVILSGLLPISSRDSKNLSLETIFTEAHQQKVSDLHWHPNATHYHLYARSRGDLILLAELDMGTGRRWINQLKSLAGLDANLHYQPLDGAFHWPLAPNQQQACRLSIVHTIHGERAVVRLHASSDHPYTLDRLGFTGHDCQRLIQCLERCHGMIIVCGPTGSGKTTTLYALCQHLQKSGKQVMTIEDPVEQPLPNISQTCLYNAQGLSYEAALKGCLRQDPDVLVVGEIRDSESLQWLCHAADCGHLVLTSLHSHRCLDALRRLYHLGMSDMQLAHAVQAVIAQRWITTTDPTLHQQSDESGNNHPNTASPFSSNRHLLVETMVMNESMRAHLRSPPTTWSQEVMMTGENQPFERSLEELYQNDVIDQHQYRKVHQSLGFNGYISNPDFKSRD